jgi:hypothetical protein
VADHKATRPATDSVNGPRAVQAGELGREANSSGNILQCDRGDRLVAALLKNLAPASEPELIERLRAAIDRIQAARRAAP